MTKPQDDSLWRPVRFKKPPRVGSTGGLSGVGFLGGQIVTFVGAGVVCCGVGTLASPWQEGKGAHGKGTRATQASPPRTTRPPPLRIRSRFRSVMIKYLPVKGTGGEVTGILASGVNVVIHVQTRSSTLI